MNPARPSRCWAEIDLAALERNLSRIRNNLPDGIRYVAVVKADAYGHGIHPTVARLMHANADAFAVANVEEGAAIQEIASGWPILVLGPVLPEEEDMLVRIGLVATVSSVGEVRRFDAAAKRNRRTLGIHLNIDTGMGRLGVWHERSEEVFRAIKEAPHLRLQGVYTHYSDAIASPDFTRTQRQRFLSAVRKSGAPLGDILVHADNSAGTEAFQRESPFNAVRVGLLQFGVTQYPDSVFKSVSIEPVFRFLTRVGLVKELPAGSPVSYGRTFVTREKTRIAILTAGYGDGLPTAASNRGEVLVRGIRCPILGRVTMDQTIVDVGKVPEVNTGDEAVLIGRSGKEEISVIEFSAFTESIPWEVFCSITKRVPRFYTVPRT